MRNLLRLSALVLGLAALPALAESPATRLQNVTPGDPSVPAEKKRGGTLTVGLMVQSE